MGSLRVWPAIVAGMVVLATALPAEARTYRLWVRQHVQVHQLKTERVDAILALMGKMLSDAGPGDHSCDVKFERHNALGSFDSTEIPLRINSEADFNRLRLAPGSVKVVETINWCSKVQPGIIGCASKPGRGLAVVRFGTLANPPVAETILWVHEFAHTTGLDHRDVQGAVMRPSLRDENMMVSAAECQTLLAGSQAAVGGVAPAVVAAGTAPVAAPAVEEEMVPIEEFLAESHTHGTPYLRASRYTSEDIPAIAAALADPARPETWVTAVGTLGAIGGGAARDILVGYMLKQPDGAFREEEFTAKTNVPMALGWLVQREADTDAIGWLLDASRAEFWEGRVVENGWAERLGRPAELIIEEMVVKAIHGLTLSGRIEAEVRLEALKASVTGIAPPFIGGEAGEVILKELGGARYEAMTAVEPATAAAVRSNGDAPLIDGSLETLRQVQEQGLLEYYAE